MKEARVSVNIIVFCVFCVTGLLFPAAEGFALGKGDKSPDVPGAAGNSKSRTKAEGIVWKAGALILDRKAEDAKNMFVSDIQDKNPNEKDENGRTVLHYSAFAENNALTDFFIRLGVLADVEDSLGWTPLNLCVEASGGVNPDAGTARTLAEAGANIHHKAPGGASPAEVSLKGGNNTFLEAILTGDSLLSTDGAGDTILHLASTRGSGTAVGTIIKAAREAGVLQSLINKRDRGGNTALDLAFQQKTSKAHAAISAALIQADGVSSDAFFQYFAPAVRSLNYNLRSSTGVSSLHYAVRERYTGWTDYLLENNADPNIKNTSGDTPLIEAARIGDMDTMRKLLNEGADVNVQDAQGNTAMHIAIPAEVHREALELLLRNDGNPNLRDMHGDSPAHIVISLNRPVDVLEVLLRGRGNVKADLSIHNVEGKTPLYIAVEEGRTTLVPLLIQYKSDIFASNNQGLTPFDKALQTGGIIIEELITPATVLQSDSGGNTPLLVAVRQNAGADIVRDILDKHALINARNQEGDTALHLAVRQNAAGTGDLLLSRGADIFLQNAKGENPIYLTFFTKGGIRDWMFIPATFSARDPQGNTILHYATQWKLDQVIPGMIQRGAEVEAKNFSGETPLFLAVRVDSASTVRTLIASGAAVSGRDTLGNTALHAAVRWDTQASAETLITAKTDVNAYNLYGNTPLHDAIRLGRFAMETLLVQRGANIEARDAEGNTALMLASVLGNYRSAEHIMRSKPDVNTRNNNGETPLIVAVRNERSDLVALLLDNGAQIHAQDAGGNSPFTVALDTSPRMVLSLLEKGRDQVDNEGRSPLDIAILAKKSAADIERITGWVGTRQLSLVDKEGRTPLRYAMDADNLVIAKFLTDQGSDVFSIARDGKTPADIALAGGNMEAVRALFGGKAINARDLSGNTILHYAAKKSPADMVKFLLDLGAERSAPNTAGETPADIAARWGNSAALEILR